MHFPIWEVYPTILAIYHLTHFHDQALLESNFRDIRRYMQPFICKLALVPLPPFFDTTKPNPFSWNFHRFSAIISIKYSNVLLKWETQLTEIKISAESETSERVLSENNPYRVVSPDHFTCTNLGTSWSPLGNPTPEGCFVPSCLASIFNHFVTPLASVVV